MLNVQVVPVEFIPTVFPYVEEYIDNALQFSRGEYTADEARVYLIRGEWQLIAAVDEENMIHGCAVVQYHNRPRSRVAFVVALGGKFISNKDVLQQFSDILRAHGATCIEGAVRKAIARLWRRYGFSEKYRIVEFEL